MDIKDDSLYPIKEAIILTGISRRSLSRKAKAVNLRQPFGVYLYTGFELKALIKQKKDKEVAKEKKAKHQATLKNQATNQATNKVGAPLNIADLQNLKLDDIEDFEFKFRRPGEFPKEGSFVFIPSEYDFAEYRPGEYDDAQDKLQEWQYQKQALIDQKKDFERLIKSQREQKEFYKDQIGFYQNMAERTLELLKNQVEINSNLSKSIFIETTIKAKNTEWKKGTEPNKKGK
tara:strand:- start:190 stop:885 length:696 start_codon:yes stop_codon:yes gene_type:complete